MRISFFDLVALTLQFSSCLFMAGVIAVIQLIHYPSFNLIHREKFAEFHSQHSKALGFIAGPTMCIELLSALWLAKCGSLALILNAVGVIFLWCLTFFKIVPMHNLLALGFDENAWRRLVRANWFRAALWSVRAILFSMSIIFFNKVSI